MTPAANVAGRRQATTRDEAIQELRDYAELYGPGFTTAAFNPSTAKWRDDPDSRERYLLGNTLRGRPWLSLNTLKKAMGGEVVEDPRTGRPLGAWNALRVAAGFEPNRPGPSNRRPDHKHAPVRDVSDRVRYVTRVERVEVEPRFRVSDVETVRALRRAEKRIAKLEREHEKVNGRLTAARDRARGLDVKWRKARERADRWAGTAATLRQELREARAQVAAAPEVEALERRVAALTGELATAMVELGQMAVQVADAREAEDAARAELELTDAETAAEARREVDDARARVAGAREAQAVAERRAEVAERARVTAETTAERATRAAADERGQRLAIQQAVAGHDRPLTPEEIQELREGEGPVGPGPFMDAVRGVLQARGVGPRREALRRVASTALRWAERT